MQQSFQVAQGPIYQSEKPVRNPRYKRFIKRFPCIACGSTRLVDPMHTGPHGLNQKASDMDCLPGCRRCHDQFDADPHGFAIRHALDIPALIESFNRRWELHQGASALSAERTHRHNGFTRRTS